MIINPAQLNQEHCVIMLNTKKVLKFKSRHKHHNFQDECIIHSVV